MTAPVDAQTACVHCGLPVGRHPVGDGPWFCCTGCAVVYEALHEAGLDGQYYRLRGVGEERGAQPAATDVDALVLSELDSEAFLNEHTREIDGGTRAAELFLDGVHCAACVWLVERLPQAVDGVLEATLDLPRARLRLEWDPEEVRPSDVARWLARFGYAAHPVRQEQAAQRTEAERRLLVKVGVCWALAGNVMLLALALCSGLDATTAPGLAEGARWLSLALAVPAVIYGGGEFFRRAWSSFRFALHTRQLRALHMDTPIALGILVGFADSTWSTLTGTGDVWFDSITVLIAALLTARWLQLRSRRLAGDATERLLSLIPTMARRMKGMTSDELRVSNGQNSSFETVPVDELAAGDFVLVPAGEVFPVDGVIERGATAVNNAVLTGESRPVAAAGDQRACARAGACGGGGRGDARRAAAGLGARRRWPPRRRGAAGRSPRRLLRAGRRDARRVDGRALVLSGAVLRGAARGGAARHYVPLCPRHGHAARHGRRRR